METFEKKKMKTHYGSVLPEQLLQVVTLLRLPVGVPTHDNHSWYVILLSGIKWDYKWKDRLKTGKRMSWEQRLEIKETREKLQLLGE